MNTSYHINLMRVILLLLITLASFQISAQSEIDFNDIAYADTDNVSQQLNVILPETGETPYPVVMIFNGRGRTRGSLPNIINFMLEQGYAVVDTSYRIGGSVDESHRYDYADGLCALAWIYNNGADYNFDMNRVLAFGSSHGGLVVNMMASVDEVEAFMPNCPNVIPDGQFLQGTIVLEGYFGFPEVLANGESAELFDAILSDLGRSTGIPREELSALLTELSTIPISFWDRALSEEAMEIVYWNTPAFWMDGNEPPILILHGSKDNVYPYEDAVLGADRLTNRRVDARLLIVPSATHSFNPLDNDTPDYIMSALIQFLQDTIGTE